MEEDAMEYSDEITHPWHPKHPLRILKNDSIADVICLSCGKLIQQEEKCYGCNTCNDFRMHINWETWSTPPPPPPLVVDKFKIHEHTLTLLPREVSFTCNACGIKGNVSPYVCLSCCFMVHTNCIDLPRFIRINRHPNRLSHAFSLASKKNFCCGVCDESIDGRYGAYTSQVDPDFVVHSRCATRNNVWDGMELEGVPEDEEAYIGSFTAIRDDRIIHFSHEHCLSLTSTNGDHHSIDYLRCYACNLHISRDPFYECLECYFFLHEKCANLDRMIKNSFHKHILTLLPKTEGNHFKCAACGHYSNGFRYSCSRCDIHLDTRCALFTVPFTYGDHDHPLYLLSYDDNKNCSACDQDTSHQRMLGCLECKFGVCFGCATLPSVIPYEDDTHPLSLNNGGNALLGEEISKRKQWCDICETLVNPLTNFYKCSIGCGMAVHTECAIGGGLRNLRAGLSLNINGYKCEVAPNDQVTRPFCRVCQSHCLGPSMLKCWSEDDHHFVTCFCCFLLFLNKV